MMEEVRMSESWQFNSIAYWRTSFEMLIGIGMINWSPDSGFSQRQREEFARQDVGLFSLGTNRHRFARIHKLMGKDEDARKITEGVLTRYPRAPRALYIAAKFAARDGDLARAMELLITLESLLPELGPTAPRYRNAIAAEVALLPATFHRDPADRIIVATALVQGAMLVTSDRRIIESKLVPTLH